MNTKTNTAQKVTKSKAEPKAVEQPTEEQLQGAMRKVITKDLTTVSSRIRALDAAGYTRSQIAKFLNKRYQHVRNVLVTPIKVGTPTTKA